MTLYLPLNVRVITVKTLIFKKTSLINYCYIVVGDMMVELSDRLQLAQNYCTRFIFSPRRHDHVTPFFRVLPILKLKELCQFHILTNLHSIFSNKTPIYHFEVFFLIFYF